MKRASNRSAKQRAPSKPIPERIEVAGAKPAAFKLVEKAADSYDLFRSGRRIGTARVEEDGSLSARFKAPDCEWSAHAKSPTDLLQLVGRYLLTIDARSAAASTAEGSSTKLKGKRTAEEKLSIAFLEKAQAHRVATLDSELTAMRKAMRKAN
jgi:hypothetical protein